MAITSITQSKVAAFLRTATDRDALRCELIRGFFLMKTQVGASWRFRYTDSTGKRRGVVIEPYHPSRKPAEVAEVALKWRLENADPHADKAARRAEARASAARTVRAYLEGAYAARQQDKKGGKATLDRIRHAFPDLLDRDMAGLTRADVTTWDAAAVKRGLARSTRVRCYGALKTMLNTAVRKDEVLSENPLAHVTLPERTAAENAALHDPDAAAHRRLLTAEELRGIRAGLVAFEEDIRRQRRNSRAHGRGYLPDLDAVAYAHWFVPFCLVAMHTGMRPGDLYALKWANLDLKFSKTLRKTPEKTLHHNAPPTITLPLSGELLEVLERWHEQAGQPTAGLVWPSPVTGEQIDRKAHGPHWREVLRLGGLPAGSIDFYSLRHHFISALVAQGVPLLTVAQMVGHKSAEMIEAHYGHLCKHTAAAAMERFSATLRKEASDEQAA